MKKRYIVCVNNSNKIQNEEFLKYLRQKKFGWWHYLDNTWLIVDTKGSSNVQEIRDKARDAFSNEYNIIFELKEGQGTWAGFGPSSKNRNMFKWIKENWS
jgi:hypothetical protein